MIPKEIIALRGENSKTYDLNNGKRSLEAHIGAVHYKDNYTNKTEPWKDIDLTWEGNRITKAPYELTHEGKKLTLKSKKTGKISTIELLEIGGKVIPSIPAIAWSVSKGLARAPGIALDTDLEVIAEFSAVRFRRILKSDKAPQEAKFKVTGDTNLVSIKASDKDGDLPVETSLKDGILTETLKPDRVVSYPIKIDPTWQVGTGTDDCARRLEATPEFNLQNPMRVGYWGSAGYEYGGGMRFTNITIPQGATIDTAYLTLRADASYAVTVVKSRISAEDVDNPATFADSGAAFDARWAARTAARVDWDNIPAWTKDEDYNSPEIKTVIKEIVDRGGWNSGQAMVIFWEDFDDRSTHTNLCWREAYAYEGSITYAPKLVIEFTPSVVAPTVTTEEVSDIGLD